jgi:hypothetical protein
VLSELDGKLAGFHTQHWDDRQDAHVLRPITRVHIPEHGLLFPGHGLVLPDRSIHVPEVIKTRRGRRVPVISGGAFTVSGLYVDNHIDVYDGTQLAIDLSLTTHKWALFTDTETPDYSVDISYAATGESSGTGYTAGGQTIVSPTTTESPAGTLMYDMSDQVWASPTSVTARGSELYADALAGNNLIVGMTFTTDFTSTAGTFTIQFASTGVFTFDLTP